MEESKDYLSDQIITYLGNKRRLLGFIDDAVNDVKKNIGKDKLILLDGFSGSGIVSRMLKRHASLLISNDMESYSHIINQCYLQNKSMVNFKAIAFHIEKINSIKNKQIDGFMQDLYAPKNDKNIKINERVFFTSANARIIDNAMNYIHKIKDESIKPFLLAPLLSEVSIHANTAGVFKGFYKNTKTGKGQFGGNAENALLRIKGEININTPIFSNFECDFSVHKEDINLLVKNLDETDIAYYDPPYNQHPYGSNYFMLNLVCNNKRPLAISRVAGIPEDWQKSSYNKMSEAKSALDSLIKETKSKYIILSYSSDGFIDIKDILKILKKYGTVTIKEKQYNTYRASRNLENRDKYVSESIFILRKQKQSVFGCDF